MENEIYIGKKERKNIWLICILLAVLTFATNYYGTTDLGDYSDTAKYFANQYSADIRSSHSYLYGFIHAPFVKLFDSFLMFKITSLLFLFAIIYSVYLMTNKNKKALLLILLSPAVWYMAPWISPIQAASFFFLWAYYFINKYDKNSNIRELFYSGIFVGLGLALWDTILFFGAFLVVVFMFNKKLSHCLVVLIAILVGLLPRLLLDQYLFDFAFFSLLKSFFGTLTNAFFLSRGTTYVSSGLDNLLFFIFVFISFPLYFWNIYKKNFIMNRKKEVIFFSLSMILIFINPQIRYTLAIIPIFIVIMANNISYEKWKKQIIFSCIVSFIFIIPYIFQIGLYFNNSEFYDITEVTLNLGNLTLSRQNEAQIIVEDMSQIASEFPDERFIIIGHQDYYQKLAHLYWGDDIGELVSIQDYELWKQNNTALFEKRFVFLPKINDRRSIWIGGGIDRNILDQTEYQSIEYAISLNDNDSLEGFEKFKKYGVLTLLKKS